MKLKSELLTENIDFGREETRAIDKPDETANSKPTEAKEKNPSNDSAKSDFPTAVVSIGGELSEYQEYNFKIPLVVPTEEKNEDALRPFKKWIVRPSTSKGPKFDNITFIKCWPLPSYVGPKPEFNITNIFEDVKKITLVERYFDVLYRPHICSIDTKCKFNLPQLNMHLPNTVYEPEFYGALRVRESFPICMLKIFENGKIQCHAFNSKSAKNGILNIISALKVLNYKPEKSLPRHNVVNATFCMPFTINLSKMHRQFHIDSVYNPRKRPFLTFKKRQVIVRFAIFESGYVYVTFSPDPKQTRDAIVYLVPILYRFKGVDRVRNTLDFKPKWYKAGDIDSRLVWERKFQTGRLAALYN